MLSKRHDPATVAAVLRAARERLTPPGAWTRWALARSGAGARVNPLDAEAVCWCVEGAVMAADGETLQPRASVFAPAIAALIRALRARGWTRGDVVPGFNDADATTQADVLAVLDEAAELAAGLGSAD